MIHSVIMIDMLSRDRNIELSDADSLIYPHSKADDLLLSRISCTPVIAHTRARPHGPSMLLLYTQLQVGLAVYIRNSTPPPPQSLLDPPPLATM